MIRKVLALTGPLALAACVTAPTSAPVATSSPPLPAAGLERVMGKDAKALTALFGDADLDVREDRGRKLQYAGAACVLDAYLYAKAEGHEAVVTWLDARTPAGGDFDRASCIAALTRRPAAR